jgi:hypothetical protein
MAVRFTTKNEKVTLGNYCLPLDKVRPVINRIIEEEKYENPEKGSTPIVTNIYEKLDGNLNKMISDAVKGMIIAKKRSKK